MSVRYDIPFKLDGGEQAPAYAVLEVVDTVDDNGREIITVEKPKEDGSGLFIANGPTAVDGNDQGAGTISFGARVRFDDAATPATGEGWSPKLGTWEIEKQEDGGLFTIVGGEDGVSVRCAILGTAGSGGSSVVPAMFIEEVEAFESISGSSREVTFGQAAQAAIILDLERNSEGDYVVPPKRMTAEQEEDPANEGQRIDRLRDCLNLTGQPIRGSSNQPVVVWGRLQTVGEVEYFEAISFEPRACLDYVIGTDPKADARALFYKGGERAARWGRTDCETTSGG